MTTSNDLRNSTDSQLVDSCLKGKADAWSELVRRYGPVIYGIARRYRLTPEDCVDVYGQVCLILLENLSRLRASDRLAGYIATTTQRACLGVLRENSRLYGTADADSVAESVGDVATQDADALSLAILRGQKLRRAINQLEPRCRQLLWMLFFDPDQPDYDTVARTLNMPSPSVGPTRQRCLDKLRTLLEKKL